MKKIGLIFHFKAPHSDFPSKLYTIAPARIIHDAAHGMTERNLAADTKPSDVLKRTKKTNYAGFKKNYQNYSERLINTMNSLNQAGFFRND